MSLVAPLALLILALADPPASPPDVVSALEATLAEAIARAEPSVVAIAREKSNDGEETTAVRGQNPPKAAGGRPEFQLLPNGEEDLVSSDYGSGVVIGDAGQILTAYHVVKGASRLVVKAAGRQQFEAEVIAADPRSDLTVIAPRQAVGVPPPTLKPLRLGDASKLRKGSFLLALGNPFNAARDGGASASWGILSNVARRLEPSFEDTNKGGLQLRHYPTLLQLDTKLNLGMSGGAVV